MATENFDNFDNPITFKTIASLLSAILEVFIIIAVPIVVIYLIYSGFMYVTAKGNPEQITKATRSIVFGLIGGVVIIGSVAILEIIKNVAEAF